MILQEGLARGFLPYRLCLRFLLSAGPFSTSKENA